MIDKIKYIKDNFSNNFEDIGYPKIYDTDISYSKLSNNYAALYTIVKILKPEYILEIGSWWYFASNNMAKAYAGVKIDSLDIAKGGFTQEYKPPENNRVAPHFWMSHKTQFMENGKDLHDWKTYQPNVVYPEFQNLTNEEIFKFNKSKLLTIAPKHGYDLIYIDGDHTYEGIAYDWEYSKLVSHNDTLIVMDDIYEQNIQPGVYKYWNELSGIKYDFADWNLRHPNFKIGIGITRNHAN